MSYGPEHTEPDNGILARIPGQYIGQAEVSLPSADSVADEEMAVEVDAGWVGRVRLTFTKERVHRPKGKFRAVFWVCRHAEAIDSPQLVHKVEDGSAD